MVLISVENLNLYIYMSVCKFFVLKCSVLNSSQSPVSVIVPELPSLGNLSSSKMPEQYVFLMC